MKLSLRRTRVHSYRYAAKKTTKTDKHRAKRILSVNLRAFPPMWFKKDDKDYY